jgi:hypothetical protein
MRAVVLSLALMLCAGAARADDVRFPERATPAFVVPLPQDWVASVDNDDNMQVSSRAKNALLVLAIGPSAGSLDDFAAGMLQSAGADPATRKEAATLAGHPGTLYYSSMANVSDPGGLRITIRLTLTRPDAATIASCALLIDASANDADIAAAQAVENGMTITTAPPPPPQ